MCDLTPFPCHLEKGIRDTEPRPTTYVRERRRSMRERRAGPAPASRAPPPGSARMRAQLASHTRRRDWARQTGKTR